MQRVLILGSGGAGKTTLARQLASRLDLPLIHLDAHYWHPHWTPSTGIEWRHTVQALAQQDRWIMDGNYRGSLDLRLPHADTIIFLDMPRHLCLWRILKRWLRYAGTTRPDLAADCPERLDWSFIRYVWSYSSRRPALLAKLRALPPDKSVVMLQSPADVQQFLNNLPAEKLPGSVPS